MSTDPRIAIVVEYLKTEGFESSEAGNYDGSLEHTAEGILERLDSARPEPSGEGLARVEAAITKLFVESAHRVISPTPADIARAAIAAMRPTGEALGLARELLALCYDDTIEDHEEAFDIVEDRTRKLLAALGGDRHEMPPGYVHKPSPTDDEEK